LKVTSAPVEWAVVLARAVVWVEVEEWAAVGAAVAGWVEVLAEDRIEAWVVAEIGDRREGGGNDHCGSEW
jgi:hypothetical protein